MDVKRMLDNGVELGFLSVEAGSELLGAISELPEEQRQIALKKLSSMKTVSFEERSSRSEFFKKMALLPKEIQMGLMQRRLQLVDSAFYFVKSVSGLKNIKMITDTDNKAAGLGNVSKQKLEKDNHFLIDSIVLLAGTALTKEDVDFDIIPKQIRNGDFEFKINGGKAINPAARNSCEVFDTTGNTTVRRGIWLLENPKLVEAELSLEFNIDFAGPAADNTWLKAILIGSSIAPY
jgi:hypothetical protein